MISKLYQLANDKKKQDFVVYGVGQAFNLLSPLIVAPYIISVCNEDGFGKVGLGFSLALFLILIVDYAFEVKSTREIAQNRDNFDELQNIINRTVFTKLSLFFIAMVIASLVINIIPFFARERLLFYFSMLLVFAQVFSPIWFLQGVGKFALGSAVNIGSKLIYVVLVFVFVTTADDYILVNLFLGLSTLIFNVCGLLIVKFKYNFTFRFPGFHVVRSIMKQDLSFCLSQLSLSVRQLSPLILMGFFLGYHAAGQYKILEQVITLFRTFIQVFIKFFYPDFCYKISVSVGSGFSFWKRYSLVTIVIVVSCITIFFVLSDHILRFFNVPEESIDYLSPLLRLAMMVPVLMSASLPLEQLTYTLNSNKVYIRITIAVTILNLLLIFLLIERFEIAGVIISLLAAELSFIILYFRNTYSVFNVESKP